MATIKQHPNLTAFLDMIAFSEGTDNGKQPTKDHGYDVLVGGQLFTSYKEHPNVLVQLNPKLKSTAAGRYQLLNRYWPHYRDLLDLEDFGPLSQDQVAIQQIKECKALADVIGGNFVKAVHKVKNIWASLPGAGYGQHEHKLDTLAAVFIKKGGTLA